MAGSLKVLLVNRKYCPSNYSDTIVFIVSSDFIGSGCAGDSTGPVFSMVEGKLTVYGPISFGEEECPNSATFVVANFWAMREYIFRMLRDRFHDNIV